MSVDHKLVEWSIGRVCFRILPLLACEVPEIRRKTWRRDLSALPLLRLALAMDASFRPASDEISSVYGYVRNCPMPEPGLKMVDAMFGASPFHFVIETLMADTTVTLAEAKASDAAVKQAKQPDSYNAGSHRVRDEAKNRFLSEYSADRDAYLSHERPETRPLWTGTPPDWFMAASEAMIGQWDLEAGRGATYAFWKAWWAGLVDGRPLPIAFRETVCLLPPSVWNAGPQPVASATRRIESEMRPLLETAGVKPVFADIAPDSGGLMGWLRRLFLEVGQSG